MGALQEVGTDFLDEAVQLSSFAEAERRRGTTYYRGQSPFYLMKANIKSL